MGAMVQITFTTVRPDANDLFAGHNAPNFQGTVACRLLMPSELARRLVRTLADNILGCHRRNRRVTLKVEHVITMRTTTPFYQVVRRDASGSVVEAWVSFERFWPWKSASALRPPPCAGGSPEPSFGLTLFIEAQASISVPSTEK